MVLNRDLNLAEGEMLLVNKPKGWTSFDVVNKMRGILRVRKIGHAGTLDPIATGLLIVCTGNKTRERAGFAGLEKEYEAEMILGARTASFDAETPVIERRRTEDVTESAVCEALQSCVGVQMQTPPMWSAAKVGGRRLYRYARKGVEVERPAREIIVHSVTPILIDIPRVRFTIVCSKGTYVRSLIDALGDRLGCGAYMTELKRTRIGGHRLEDALSLEDLLRIRDGYGA